MGRLTAVQLDTDVLVVGGGPAGASVATYLARAGHHVTIVEKRPVARHKACGDILTPRALGELARLEVDPLRLDGHRIVGVRLLHGRREVAAPWPQLDDVADHAAVLRRDVLDAHLRVQAAGAGATVLMGHEATTPIAERGFVRGAQLAIADDLDADASRAEAVRSRFVVVADGANSSFGRGLGTTRHRQWPYGITTRTYFASPRHTESWIETELGILDAAGNPIAGYGWVIPVGDGTVNVGVALLSTYRDARGVNALKLLDSFVQQIADRWGLDPAAKLKAPTRFRVPLGGSVGPKMGPTFLVAGDAAGSASPFNGDGIDAALMSGRLAAEVLDEALTSGNSTTLQRYPNLIADQVGQYHKVGRLTARFLGRPAILRPALRLGLGSERVAGAALRIATNELRDDRPGGAERAYAVAATISKFAPNW
ncbi:MAG: geranylgeranyl reductase family protein [Ilumatobacteraceae bacterium]